MSLIDDEYPTIEKETRARYRDFVENRCSDYYFLGYLRCTNGNLGGAAKFYNLDDSLRTLLLKHIVRLEIQLKTDFFNCVENATGSDSIWSDSQYYLPSSCIPNQKSGKSKFDMVKENIDKALNKHPFSTPGPANMRAATFMSFGAFVDLYKNIDLQYKKAFISEYTDYLPFSNATVKDRYRILFKYLQAIRIVRNRCAHGNHVITRKLLYELTPQIDLIRQPNTPFSGQATVFEAVLLFILKKSNCSPEFQGDIKKILKKYQGVLAKYNSKHSLSNNVMQNLNLI